MKIAHSLLKATPKKAGLFRNLGRALASKEWADEIDKLEKELHNSMQRYHVHFVSFMVLRVSKNGRSGERIVRESGKHPQRARRPEGGRGRDPA